MALASTSLLGLRPSSVRCMFLLLLAPALAQLVSSPTGSSKTSSAAHGESGKVPQLSEPAISMDEEDIDTDDTDDTALMGAPTVKVTKKQRAVGAAKSPDGSPMSTVDPLRPAVPEDSEDWQAQFAWGLYYSNLAVEGQEGDQPAGGWVLDTKGTGSAIPRHMLHAEELMAVAVEKGPDAKVVKAKNAERALRLYNHGKWLAERGFAAPAEVRYREAATVAKQARRNVLAAHALSRLGYYLIYWSRRDEAREVLAESERLSSKSNPLAPYLSGVLEREAAGTDTNRLHEAEQKILDCGDLPSEELQAERQELVKEIQFWRSSQESVSNCFSGSNAANVLICLMGHVAFGGGGLQQLLPRFSFGF